MKKVIVATLAGAVVGYVAIILGVSTANVGVDSQRAVSAGVAQTQTNWPTSIPSGVTMNLTPLSLASSKADATRYQVQIAPRVPADVSGGYVLNILDARRTTALWTKKIPAQRLSRGTSITAAETLPTLDDGYYIVHLSAALSDGDVTLSNGVESYLSVATGRAKTLSPSDFVEQSGAMVSE